MISRRVFLKAGAVFGAGLFLPWKISLPNFLKALIPTRSKAEQDLIRRIQAGDPEAFRQFYAEYSSLVFHHIRSRVNSDADAEDFTAETFIRAWRAFPSNDPPDSSLRTWLFRIADTVIKTPGRRVSLQSLQRCSSAAFETLSQDEKLILHLAYDKGYSNKEIAKIVGKTENAVGVAKYRALKRLREHYRYLNSALPAHGQNDNLKRLGKHRGYLN